MRGDEDLVEGGSRDVERAPISKYIHHAQCLQAERAAWDPDEGLDYMCIFRREWPVDVCRMRGSNSS